MTLHTTWVTLGPSDVIKIVSEWIEKATEKERGVFGEVSIMLLQ